VAGKGRLNIRAFVIVNLLPGLISTGLQKETTQQMNLPFAPLQALVETHRPSESRYRVPMKVVLLDYLFLD
jgi:hypothetical protein